MRVTSNGSVVLVLRSRVLDASRWHRKRRDAPTKSNGGISKELNIKIGEKPEKNTHTINKDVNDTRGTNAN